MIRGNAKGWLWLALISNSTIHARSPKTLCDAAQDQYEIQNRYTHQNGLIRDFFVDILKINKNLFSKQAILAFAGFVPAYIGARQADDGFHHKFYDYRTHTDTHQLPRKLCKAFGDEGIAVPIVLFSSLAIFAKNERLRRTSEMFAKGVVAIQITKKIIKEATKHECNVRPFCGRFEKVKTYGGFPSGHMAVSSFMAFLYGIRHGRRWGIPLGAYAIANFGVGLNCNRHFASQLVIGAALGTAYAFATLKTINDKYGNFDCELTTNNHGKPAVQMTYSY